MLYKPYGVISQFTAEEPGQSTLKDLYAFPPDVYPVGRLDLDSEGLLLLCNDPAINASLLHPQKGHQRTYLVQVEGIPSQEAIQQLRAGVEIRINKKSYHTLPAQVVLLDKAPDLPERNPPIRFRKNVPDSWLEISLREGKNRQVRKMCAKVGHPVLRLIRSRIGGLRLVNMVPGQVIEMDEKEIKRLLDL